MQRGITGDVKFTLSGYRNITNLNVKEITENNEYQVHEIKVISKSEVFPRSVKLRCIYCKTILRMWLIMERFIFNKEDFCC